MVVPTTSLKRDNTGIVHEQGSPSKRSKIVRLDPLTPATPTAVSKANEAIAFAAPLPQFALPLSEREIKIFSSNESLSSSSSSAVFFSQPPKPSLMPPPPPRKPKTAKSLFSNNETEADRLVSRMRAASDANQIDIPGLGLLTKTQKLSNDRDGSSQYSDVFLVENGNRKYVIKTFKKAFLIGEKTPKQIEKMVQTQLASYDQARGIGLPCATLLNRMTALQDGCTVWEYLPESFEDVWRNQLMNLSLQSPLFLTIQSFFKIAHRNHFDADFKPDNFRMRGNQIVIADFKEDIVDEEDWHLTIPTQLRSFFMSEQSALYQGCDPRQSEEKNP